MIVRAGLWRAFAVVFAACLVATAWATGGRAAEPIDRIPYRIDYGGWFTVSVTVNGEGPYDFIIDTGSTNSLVFESLAREHHFPPSGGPPQTVLGLSAQGQFPTYRIGRVAVGAAAIDDLVSVVLADWLVEDRGPKGVLGLDFLRDFVLIFDEDRGELRLYAPGVIDEAVEEWRRIDLTVDTFGLEAGELYTIRGYLNGRSMPFLFDLGANGSIINYRAYARLIGDTLDMRIGPSGSGQFGRIVDALEKSSPARGVLVMHFRAGRQSWRRQQFTVFNPPLLFDLGVERTPFGIFGSDLLQGRSFLIDFAGGRLLVGPKSQS